MKNIFVKVKLIFIPFLIIAVGFIGLYSFLNWLFIIQWHLVNINEEVINVWLPLGLIWIPLFIWLRPRIKLLSLKEKNSNLPSLYFCISIIAIIAPTLIIQTYLITATGQLTKLQNIDQITTKPVTKYYSVEKHFIDKQHAMVYRRTEVSGRNSEYLTFHIYLACPIVSYPIKYDTIVKSHNVVPHINLYNFRSNKKPMIVIDGKPDSSGSLIKKIRYEDIAEVSILKGKTETALYGKGAYDGVVSIITKKAIADINKQRNKKQFNTIPSAWLGTEYTKTLSNRLSDVEKESTFKQFNNDTYQQFVNQDLNQFIYLDHIGNNDRSKGYLAAIKTSNTYSDTNPIILEAQTTSFKARNGDEFQWIFKSFGIGAGIFLMMIIIPKLNSKELEKFTGERWRADLIAFYKPLTMIKWRNSNITAVLIAVNILVFIIMVFAGLGFISFDAQDLFKWGANYRPAVLNGQWWRLITCMFLHGGLMHLVMNMYGLIFASLFLQPLLGNIKYTLAYFTCGILASLTSIWWHPATVGVGASGAIFGLYGVATALLTTRKVSAGSKKAFLISYLIFISINLLFGFMGGVDNAAHIGGLLSGFIMGYILYFFIDTPKPPKRRIIKKKLDINADPS